MKDVEYVKAILADEYATEHSHEIPHPNLAEVIRDSSCDYLVGTVTGEVPNGRKSREGHDYLWFQHGKKSILTHRFIAAITLGKGVPRDFDVDHVNHNPSDNRPRNLRIVTPRDNAGNRRKALLSELADLDAVSQSYMERKFTEVASKAPEMIADQVPSASSFGDPISQSEYTGETKPGKTGGTWYKTHQGSWHLRFD